MSSPLLLLSIDDNRNRSISEHHQSDEHHSSPDKTSSSKPVKKKMRHTVTFDTPLIKQVIEYDGVTEEEKKNVWYQRMDHMEFMKNEIIRRQLLFDIEHHQHARDNKSDDDEDDEEDNNNNSLFMKHTITRELLIDPITLSSTGLSRQQGSRSRQLPKRQKKHELDRCYHFPTRLQRMKNKSLSTDGPRIQVTHELALTAM